MKYVAELIEDVMANLFWKMRLIVNRDSKLRGLGRKQHQGDNQKVSHFGSSSPRMAGRVRI